MKIRHLEIFVAAIECRGLSRASEHLNMSQPAVSAAIKALEEQLSTVLFERPKGSRNVKPTSSAMRFYLHARDILRRCDAARSSVLEHDPRPPKIRVGALHTLSATDIADFQFRIVKDLPAWRWTIREGSALALSTALKEKRLDIAWSVIEQGETEARILWQEPYVAMLSKHHPLAMRGHNSLQVSDLRGDQIILRGRCELPRHALQDAGFSIKPAARAERDELALAMVACGLGFAIAPRNLATEDVVALPVDDFDQHRTIGLKWRPSVPAEVVDSMVSVLLNGSNSTAF
jgi:DNA-binding transcriptional LysR family regulator